MTFAKWQPIPSEQYVYTPPTLRDWIDRGFVLGTVLQLKPGTKRQHRCSRRLMVADAVFGMGPDAMTRFVVVCYCCGIIWDTGIRMGAGDSADRPGTIADLRAIKAAQAFNNGE